MGEYYQWINIDKKEYICPGEFDYCLKVRDSSNVGNTLLCALYTLLNHEWKGDQILWFGDECPIPEHSPYKIIRRLYQQWVDFGSPEEAFTLIYKDYRNVSCDFKEAQEGVHRQVEFYLSGYQDDLDEELSNEYGIDPEHPFEGMFQKSVCKFEYVLNHTKKVCYSPGKTKVFSLNGEEIRCTDPLPILMAFGIAVDPGKWIGDAIGVDNEIPNGYQFLDTITVKWK